MSNLTVLEKEFKSPQVMNQLGVALGVDINNEAGVRSVQKYVYGVVQEIARSAGTENDLTKCTPQSIIAAVQDACSFGIVIDGRKHAALINRRRKVGNIFVDNVVFEPMFGGYVAKVKEVYPDADVGAIPVYEGDHFTGVISKGSQQTFEHRPKNPHRSGKDGLLGVLVYATYTDHGRLVEKAFYVTRDRIDFAYNAAKAKFVWDKNFVEKAKAAAIKAALKLMFKGITALERLVDYDNNHNSKLPEPAAAGQKSIIDNILSDDDTKSDVIDVEPEEYTPPVVYVEAVYMAGKSAAENGYQSFVSWGKSLTPEERQAIDSHLPELSAIAKQKDEEDDFSA